MKIDRNKCMECKFMLKYSFGTAFFMCVLPRLFSKECPQNEKH